MHTKRWLARASHVRAPGSLTRTCRNHYCACLLSSCVFVPQTEGFYCATGRVGVGVSGCTAASSSRQASAGCIISLLLLLKSMKKQSTLLLLVPINVAAVVYTWTHISESYMQSTCCTRRVSQHQPTYSSTSSRMLSYVCVRLCNVNERPPIANAHVRPAGIRANMWGCFKHQFGYVTLGCMVIPRRTYSYSCIHTIHKSHTWSSRPSSCFQTAP